MSTADTDLTLKRLRDIDLLLANGDLSAAAIRLEDVARLAPNDPRVYLIGAHLAEAAGNPKDAIYYTRRAASLNPEWPVPVTELAHLLARLGHPREALDAAQQAVTLAPNNLALLCSMVGIAHQALSPQLALTWLERAARLAPENDHVRKLMARDLSQLGNYPPAIAIYTALLEQDATDVDVRLGRAKAALAAGDTALAVQDTETLLAHDPANATYQFWHSVARGEVPPTQPAAMTQALFDGYAPVFDMHLVEGLQYQVPARVAALVGERYPDGMLDLLDLGCGTGLLGKYLGGIHGLLIGVDLSPGMLAQAAQLQIYDDFLTTDLLTALRGMPADCYDVVAACDVFIYSGDLTEVVPATARALKPGGHFIFSCEAAQPDEADLVLRPSTRYAHKARHVRALCTAAGLTNVTQEDTTIRVESGQRIGGYIVVARKPA